MAGVSGGAGSKAADLIANGRVDLSPLVSHVVPLEDAREAFQLVLDGQAVKPLLAVHG